MTPEREEPGKTNENKKTEREGEKRGEKARSCGGGEERRPASPRVKDSTEDSDSGPTLHRPINQRQDGARERGKGDTHSLDRESSREWERNREEEEGKGREEPRRGRLSEFAGCSFGFSKSTDLLTY